MPNRLPGRFGVVPPLPLGSVLFFGLFLLYVGLRVDPSLIYQGYWVSDKLPTFSRGPAFFGRFLAYPGGPVEYVSAFLCQLFYFRWLGALVLMLVAWVLCAATRVVLGSTGGGRLHALHLGPAVLLLLLYGRYANPLPTALALCAAMLSACAYVRTPLRGSLARLGVFLALGGALCYVAAGAVLVYAVVCGILEAASGRRPLGLIYVGAAIAAWFVAAAWVLQAGVEAAYVRLVPPFGVERDEVVIVLTRWLHLFFPVAALGMALQRRLAERWARAAARAAGQGEAAPLAGRAARSRRLAPVRLASAFALLALVAGSVWSLFDDALSAALRVRKCACEGDWSRLLAEARRLPRSRYDLRVNWAVNEALYHTGRLPYDMFSYRQDRVGLVPTGESLMRLGVAGSVYMAYSDVLLELGAVNESEHMAHEALELLGDRPLVLERLAVVNLAKTQEQAARVFLGALSKDVIHGKWARDCLRRLDDDPTMSADGRLRRIRSLALQQDEVGPFTFEMLLGYLLRSNRHNRMAFEYMMADHLLNGQLEEVVRNLDRLDDFDYPGIPRHYEEAIVLYEHASGRKADLHGRTVSAAAEERFREFQRVLADYGIQRSAARRALQKTHGDSYFYYYEFLL